MQIKIKQPLGFSEIGSRKNNEDNIYPPVQDNVLLPEANPQTKLFLVCDGVGGSEKGEVASDLACQKIGEYYQKHQDTLQVFVGNADIDQAVEYAEKAFDDYFITSPEAEGMGTTLTLLAIHKRGITIAFAGDSRIYHVRKSQEWHTRDHSMLNTLIDQGIVSPAEAHLYAKKNMIVRAIQGEKVRKTQAETYIITDIQKGDYFFLCTDGVLENVEGETLTYILEKKITNEEKLSEIRQLGRDRNNKDNFSCYLIEIDEVQYEDSEKASIVPFTPYQEPSFAEATIIEGVQAPLEPNPVEAIPTQLSTTKEQTPNTVPTQKEEIPIPAPVFEVMNPEKEGEKEKAYIPPPQSAFVNIFSIIAFLAVVVSGFFLLAPLWKDDKTAKIPEKENSNPPKNEPAREDNSQTNPYTSKATKIT